MAKKKVKKAAKKTKKIVKKVAKKKIKKVVRAKAKKIVKKKLKTKAPALPKEKILGKVDHYFDHIQVAAIKVLAPFKVGELVHFKGHTTDFIQKIDSMQIEHQSVPAAQKGDDIGIKVKERVREHDVLYLSSGIQPVAAKPAAAQAKSMFQTSFLGESKPIVPQKAKSAVQSTPVPTQSKPESKPSQYSNTKFLSF